jgi:hypothetical protein
MDMQYVGVELPDQADQAEQKEQISFTPHDNGVASNIGAGDGLPDGAVCGADQVALKLGWRKATQKIRHLLGATIEMAAGFNMKNSNSLRSHDLSCLR